MPADNLDYLFLSALAVSNRHIVYGLERDEAERKRIRHWYDWARAHEDLMTRQAVFLPDWQGNGKCDSYFRLNAAGTGYAFVFNANDTPVSTELPLDERCGLVAGREYRVRPEFPDSPDTQVARRSVAVTVPARQVLLLELVSYRQPQLMNPKGQGPILTCFGRTARGGFFCGVELPFDASSQNANSVVLAYRPNLKIRAGPRLTCEPAYLGVYRKGASEQAPEGLPLRSESDAMVAMTAAILPPQQRRLGPLMCGWWSELYRGPYRTGGDVENHLGAVDFALDCGIDIISDPRTWAGELDKINVLREGEELQLGELALKVAASARHKGARWVFWPTMGNSDPWGNNTDGDPQWRNGIDLPTRLEADAGGDKSYWLTVAPETEIHWRIRSAGGSLTMQFSGNGANLGKVEGVELVFPFAPGVTPVTAISGAWDDDGSFQLPALVSAPDFGQLLLTGKSAGPDRKPIKKARLDGSRAAKTVNLVLELTVPQAGAVDALEFAPHLLAPPAGLADTALWSQARRGWFSIWQPSAQWGDQGNPFSAPAGMLGNNVISDPASCSLWFYCNALIYRAWRCLADLEKKLGRNEPEARYTQLADKLKAAYAPTLLNPATGWLAWWKSADGELHDYAAPTVNGLAIEYGLVEPVQGRAILAKLRQKMADVGFTRFDLGVLESSLGLYGWARVPKSYPVTLPLKAGENRLLVKFTSLHNAHGFAFHIPQLTGLKAGDENDMAAVLASTKSRFTPVDQPLASTGPVRDEMFWERQDGIWEGLDTASPGRAVLYDRYAQSLLRAIGLSNESLGRLPQAKEAAGVATVRQLYHRARRYTAALERLRDFRFDVEPTQMHDPPQLRMHQMLEQHAPHSPEGKRYLERLAAVKPDVEKALAKAERGEPDGEEALIRCAEQLDAVWRDELGRLPPILFIRCPPFRYGGFGPYACDGAAPASLCLFDPSRPDQPPRVVFHEPDLRIYDMTLSYDARTVFFSARRNGVAGAWHIYEIGIDGQHLKQITRGESSNISPAELPNGDIVFVSTRSGTYAQCQPVHTGHLYVMHRDGSNVRKVSANIDSDHSPQVLNDGRVLFTRWDYGVEKNVFTRQALWAMNPDGTAFELFFGNTIEDPCSFWTAVPIPGRSEVACVLGPHHGEQAGSVGLVWNRLGPEAPRGEGFRWVTRELPSHGDITFAHGYSRPFPVHECLFLVSYGGDGQTRNRLYLLDDRGNRKCIYEDAQLGYWNPLLVRPREVPPVIPPRCDSVEFVCRDPEESNRGPDDGPQATLVVSDVYQGVSAHIARGEVQAIQVMEQVQKSRQRRPTTAWSTVSPIIGRGTQHVRRLVGTLPVEADGSAHFRVPALKSISLNLLDREGRVLMSRGSDMHLMPGERRSCVGCHETRRPDGLPPSGPAVGPPSPSWQTSLAARRDPSVPQRPDWGTYGIVDFARVVQPVLDKYCVKCHSGPTPDGAIDLSGDRTRFFSLAYDNLIERGLVDWFSALAQGVDENTPKMHGALVSRLGQSMETDQHYGAKVPPEDRRRIYTWVDANVPYYGTYAYNKFREGSPGQRDGWDLGNKDGWLRKELQPVFERRCLACHQRVVDAQTAYYGVKLPVTSKLWTDQALNEHALWCAEQVLTFKLGPELRINLTHPEWSLVLTAPLAKSAGGLGLCSGKDGASGVFRDTGDPDYRQMLFAIRQGHQLLMAHPRADMVSWFGRPGANAPIVGDSQEIAGVTINSVSSQLVGTTRWGQRLDRGASRMLDGSGLGCPADDFGCAIAGASFGTHSSNPDGTSWSIAGIGYACGFADDDPSPWVVFDLGGLYDLERIRVWNYNERGGYSKRGVKELEILVSADNIQFASLGPFALARAPESEDVDFSQNLSLADKAQRVRYVKFLILSNHNGADYKNRKPGPDWSMVGLSEVKFYRRGVQDRAASVGPTAR